MVEVIVISDDDDTSARALPLDESTTSHGAINPKVIEEAIKDAMKRMIEKDAGKGKGKEKGPLVGAPHHYTDKESPATQTAGGSGGLVSRPSRRAEGARVGRRDGLCGDIGYKRCHALCEDDDDDSTDGTVKEESPAAQAEGGSDGLVSGLSRRAEGARAGRRVDLYLIDDDDDDDSTDTGATVKEKSHPPAVDDWIEKEPSCSSWSRPGASGDEDAEVEEAASNIFTFAGKTFTKIDIKDDGHCMYRAIGYLFGGIVPYNQGPCKMMDIRKGVADGLRKILRDSGEEEFREHIRLQTLGAPSCQHHSRCRATEYIRRQECGTDKALVRGKPQRNTNKNTIWGGEVELRAASQHYGVNIRIHSMNAEGDVYVHEVKADADAAPTIYLLHEVYKNGLAHYSALIPSGT